MEGQADTHKLGLQIHLKHKYKCTISVFYVHSNTFHMVMFLQWHGSKFDLVPFACSHFAGKW